VRVVMIPVEAHERWNANKTAGGFTEGGEKRRGEVAARVGENIFVFNSIQCERGMFDSCQTGVVCSPDWQWLRLLYDLDADWMNKLAIRMNCSDSCFHRSGCSWDVRRFDPIICIPDRTAVNRRECCMCAACTRDVERPLDRKNVMRGARERGSLEGDGWRCTAKKKTIQR
jgi:hypothetical protein